MHYITEIKDIGKKCRIIIDDDIVVQLYKGEVRKLGIKADSQFSNESYNEMYNILNKRARERSLFLLKDMDKTEKQIRDKLKLGDYPEDIINNAIEFLKKYGYVDDIRYAKLYISSKQNSKSIKQIKLELYKKGVNKENVSKVLLEMDLSNEEALNKLIEKIIKKYDLNDKTQYNKMCRYLLGKGFSYGEIQEALFKYTNYDTEW
ncbi:regulatory protein RecX [Eubacterium sp. AF19-12LB]|uniref:regulatory protein RecX n=1 Tax=Eubacterium sp. AF19-12LB TaxID=2293106 RepID=UPI000E49EEA0|nr:regulatory protein RecX [Eubacterium sp. AF19-12LB]RHR36648.1 regulatory protein RecX [Eubacterium sp. AF19-12LB]